jgi:hypothetical protein
MYQLNETNLWNQHHHDLLREAQDERLARQLRASRRKRDRGTGNGWQSSALRRTAAVWSRTSVPFFRA